MIIFVQCEKTPFENEDGLSGVKIDTVEFDADIIDSIKNISIPVSSNNAEYNMVGNFKDVTNIFSLEFKNLGSLHYLSDSEKVDIKNAKIKFNIFKEWDNSDDLINVDIRLIAPDSIYQWNNYSELDSVWSLLYDNSTDLDLGRTLDLTGDSTLIDLDLNILSDWVENADSNNGIIFEMSSLNENEMIAFYSYDYSDVSKIPELIVECEILDTNDIFQYDSTFTISATSDLQYSESIFEPSDSVLLASQGSIFRPVITLDSLRFIDDIDSKTIINSAVVSFAIDQIKTDITVDDSLTFYIGYFWDDEEVKYDFANGVEIEDISNISDTISFNIPYVIQKTIATDSYNKNGIFIQVKDERYDFNRIYFKKESFKLNLIYTNFIRENE